MPTFTTQNEILIHAPVGKDAVLIQRILEKAGQRAAVCDTLAELAQQMSPLTGAVLLTEDGLLDNRAEVAFFRERLRIQPPWSDMPIVLLTAKRQGNLEVLSRTDALFLQEMGNVYSVERPIGTYTLLSIARVALRARQKQFQVRDLMQALEESNATLEKKVEERTRLAEIRAIKLRDLALALNNAEQKERQRLAVILHDHLQQLLVAAKISVGQLKHSRDMETVDEYAEKIAAMLGEAIDASRSLTIDLNPPILKDAGLRPSLEWLGRQFKEKYGLTVSVGGEGNPELVFDETKNFLFQAVRELLFNIVKHSGALEAQIFLEQAGGDLRLQVSDTGKGFDAATLLDYKGKGFGLFHLAERLEGLGGKLDVDTAPGQGTNVKMQIRAKTRQEKEEPAGDVIKRSADGSRSDRLRVMVVDDHKIFRQGIISILKGVETLEVVGEANDGEEAYERTGEWQPDIIIMDITMPRLNGIEATRKIKTHYPDVHIVGLSLHESEDMAQAMLDAGASAYQNKAAPIDDLLQKIQMLPV